MSHIQRIVLDYVAMVHIDFEAKRTAQKMDHNALQIGNSNDTPSAHAKNQNHLTWQFSTLIQKGAAVDDRSLDCEMSVRGLTD